MAGLVSVVIPTYNRFDTLLEAIASVKAQTYPEVEIIVVDDASTDPRYREYEYPECQVIHLPLNSKALFGNPAPGYVRAHGMKAARGAYIAFLDDDDVWFPDKLRDQIDLMRQTNCLLCASEARIGYGRYQSGQGYPLYNREWYWEVIRQIFLRKGSGHLIEAGYPKIWTRNFLQVHNTIITSSVVMATELVYREGFMRSLPAGEDYEYWLRLLQHTDCCYLDKPSLYYTLRP